MSILQRHNVNVFGRGSKTIMFAHGLGCNQGLWRFMVPAFLDQYRVLLFDVIGSDRAASPNGGGRYDTLDGYADDILEIAREMGLRNAIFVGHSISAMTGLLASIKEPARFTQLVMIGPSPRYLNDDGYLGGFERSNVEEILATIASDYHGWAKALAPAAMGNPDRPELAAELEQTFRQMSPEVAKSFAKVIFMSDNREHLQKLKAKTLILQATNDIIAPLQVGEFLNRQISGSELVVMKATGHYPSLSAPQETVAEIKAFLNRSPDLSF